MTKCILCNGVGVHEPECPTDEIMISEMTNIDIRLNKEVKLKIEEYKNNIKKYGYACDSHGYE